MRQHMLILVSLAFTFGVGHAEEAYSSQELKTQNTRIISSADISHEMYDVYEVAVDSGFLNIRKSPSKRGSLVGQIDDGECVLAKKGSAVKSEGLEWVKLAYPKGWASKRFLTDSEVCEDAFSIIDGYYRSALKECSAAFHSKKENGENHFYVSQEMKEWIADYVDSDKAMTINCKLNCEDIKGNCKMLSNEEDYTGAKLFRCDKPVETIFDILKWITPECDRYCNFRFSACHDCGGIDMQFFKCGNTYEAFVDGFIGIYAEPGMKAFSIIQGGIECCSNITITFTNTNGIYKITYVRMFLD